MSRIDELQPGYSGPQTPNVGRDNLAALLSRFFQSFGGGGQGAFPAAPAFAPFSNDPGLPGTAPVPTARPQQMPGDNAPVPTGRPSPVQHMNRGMY